MQQFVTVEQLLDELRTAFKFHIDVLASSDEGMARPIISHECNRPGLILTGFDEAFASQRIQVFGRCEHAFLLKLDREGAMAQVRTFLEKEVPLVVFAHGLKPPNSFLEICSAHQICVISTPRPTSSFILDMHKVYEDSFGVTDSIHGVFTEVFGLGVLITGPSGVGKSETAVELLERGHRLIADDLVLLRRTSYRTIDGFPSPASRYLMEIRGIGIIDVRTLYGIGAVREKKRIEVVVELVMADGTEPLDRTGLARKTIWLLDVKLPLIRLPVRPGRNIPILVEVIAMNQRAQRLGFDAAKEFERRHYEMLSE